MSEDEDGKPLSRRGFIWGLLGVAGGAAVGEGILLARDMDSHLPMEMNIYQTEELTDLADEYGRDPDHPARIVEAHAREAFDQLFDDMGMDPDYSINVVQEPVSNPYDGDDVEAFNQTWNRMLDDRDDAAESANLLIDSDSYDALGRGESGQKLAIGPFEQEVCGTSHDMTNSGVLGTGEALYWIDPGDIRDQVLSKEVRRDDDETMAYTPPHQVAFAGVHELGHNSCLHHDMGTLVEEEDNDGDTNLYSSLMLHSYTEAFTGDTVHRGRELPDPEPPYDIYRVNRFSQTAAEAYRDELDGL